MKRDVPGIRIRMCFGIIMPVKNSHNCQKWYEKGHMASLSRYPDTEKQRQFFTRQKGSVCILLSVHILTRVHQPTRKGKYRVFHLKMSLRSVQVIKILYQTLPICGFQLILVTIAIGPLGVIRQIWIQIWYELRPVLIFRWTTSDNKNLVYLWD